ncbi:MAG: 50S ribosome-binding GTPase, partial [Phycisphaerae bacterium]|nr:50S ribosome-binding GTPase [Phycisphaerae bacterium]
MNLDETIVAIASPAGSAQRGILRLSGADAVTISDRVFRPVEGPPIGERETFSVCAGSLCLDGQRLEIPAEVYLMRSPRSYTREDVVEFHMPSCPALWPAVLEAFTRGGVRLAEPGEFTARAFLNGRLDLARAEAVMAIVNASSQRALRAATEMLSGHLSARVGPIGQEIRNLLGLVEAGIDFAEDDIQLISPEDLQTRVLALRDRLIDLGRHGRRIGTFDGSVRLTIAGRPNAGKSSLFNAILGYSRTIVANLPGTTRDRISHGFTIGGVAFELSDTAGLGAGSGALDRAAHQKAIEALDYADLALIV